MAADLPAATIVFGNVRVLRTTQTVDIYLVSLLPPSVPKSTIALHIPIQKVSEKHG